MSDTRRIDEALRNVPVPDDLQPRLQPESLFADAEIDRLLAKVTVPVGLADTIRAAAHGQPSRHRDGAIDLSRFTAPSQRDLGQLFFRRALPSRHRSGLASLARDLASVAAALGLVVVLAVAGIEFSRQLEGTPPGARAITRLDFSDSVDDTSLDWPLRFHVPDGMWDEPEHSVSLPSAPTAGMPNNPNRLPPSGSVPPVTGNVTVAPSQLPDTTIVRGAPVLNVPPSGVLGPKAMMTVEIPGASRRLVPRVRGYDLAFEMTTGEHPFVNPSADPSLVTDRPPLTLRVDSLEALTATDGGSRRRFRAEEVLAAVQAPPAGRLAGQPMGLGIHEVRALRAVGGTRAVLVEVAATAGPIQRGDKPIDATLVLDQAAAGDPAVWRRVCRALGDLASQLTQEDRVSVVLCGPRPRVAVQSADANRLAALASDLEWQSAAASSDIDAGLLLARPAGRIIVVAHAISLETAGGMLRESLSAWHNALSSVGGDTLACEPVGGTRFIILDPAAPPSSAYGEPAFGRTSPDAVAVRRALIRQVIGRDTLVASQCDLEVKFDPRRVARYRLIGHRQSVVESLADISPRGVDLHAGETVRVVYEVIPRPSEVIPGLASAVFSWRTQEGDRRQLESGQNRSSADLADGLPSPHGCELLLAAGLGELASGSAHIGRRPAFATSLERLVTDWRGRGDVTPLGEALARSLDRRNNGVRNGW